MQLYQEKNRPKELSEQNHTGIPAQLKKRVEDNTALELDDVRIHYNSGRPAELDALAYTQGTQVYLGPGQERHLPHELGHVVQQKLGMVRADTRHESGAALNTDQALERQADRIGAGSERMAMPLARRHSEPIVQRMSVLENGDELGAARAGGRAFIPRIGRYKRSGWLAVRTLKEYLTEACIEKVNMGNLDELSRTIPILETEQFYDRMARVAGGMEVFEYEPKFQSELQEKMGAAGAARTPLEEWNGIAERLQAVLKQCSAVVKDMDEEKRAALTMKELEKTGKYKRLKPIQEERGEVGPDFNYEERGEVDPYFNYKKAALYCIAQKASVTEGKESVGPHIALSVIGKKIYAAINSSFAHNKAKTPIKPNALAVRIRNTILSIQENEIRGILSKELIPNAKFELGVGQGREWPSREIHQYIQQLRNYPVLIVGTQKYDALPQHVLGPIHGEMAIMDYLQHSEGGRQLIADRARKLDEIETTQGGKLRRVIWIGGTRVDCAKCHEHFGEINASDGKDNCLGHGLERTYVVSSREVGNGGELYHGTEGGTHLSAKKAHPEVVHDEKELNILQNATTEIIGSFPSVGEIFPKDH